MSTLPEALAEIRKALLAPGLIQGEGRGKRRDAAPSVVKATVRPVVLKSGPVLQIVTDDGQRPTTRNITGPGEIDKLLAEPFGSWVVTSETGTISLQTTRKGAIIHRSASPAVKDTSPAHDREKKHLLDPGDPLFGAIE